MAKKKAAKKKAKTRAAKDRGKTKLAPSEEVGRPAEKRSGHSLPTDIEIESLPQLASIAFCARCARRVFPLLQTFGDADVVQTIDGMLESIEYGHESDLRDLALHEHRLAEMGRLNDSFEFDVVNAISAITSRAGRSALYVIDAVTGVLDVPYVYAIREAIAAIEAYFPSKEDRSEVERAIARDFQIIRHRVKLDKWTDDTPVPRDIFGPMWVEEPPKGWPGSDGEKSGESMPSDELGEECNRPPASRQQII